MYVTLEINGCLQGNIKWHFTKVGIFDLFSPISGPKMGSLNKNYSEKSNTPHMPVVPHSLGLSIHRCISYSSKVELKV